MFSPRRMGAVSAVLIGLVTACAQQGTPPGGPEDVRPPVVVRTVPEAFAVVDSTFDGVVRFDFDERISERPRSGSMDDAVVISPRTGEPRVKHGRRGLTVELDGGFRPGQVYRITLLPVAQDLFNNGMNDPFELVFSTGPEPSPTTIAGIVWDRISGRGAADYEVQARPQELIGAVTDTSVVHLARTDTGGVYAFRYIPPGRYRITAYEDRDRDGNVDTMEVQGFTRQLIGDADTLFADISVLAPDTTPAILTGAEVLDSITVVLEFDDYLDPDIPLQSVGARVTLAEDSSFVTSARVLHAFEYTAWAEGIVDSLAVLDSLDFAAWQADRDAERAAQAVRDSLAAIQDSIRAAAGDTATVEEPEEEVERPAPPPRPEARPVPVGLDGRPQARPAPPGDRRRTAVTRGPGGERLPEQKIVALLEIPLRRAVGYRIEVTGVRNIAAVPVGGGTAALVLPAADEPDEPEGRGEVPGAPPAVVDTMAVDTMVAPVPRRR